MKRLTIIFALLSLRTASAADVDYQNQIRRLEERVAVLERSLQDLLEERKQRQTPAAPAMPSPAQTQGARARFEMPPELVPEIGKVGAEVGLLLSGSANPFHLNSGKFVGGFIDLPIAEKQTGPLRGKLGYEISVGMSQSKTTFATTSNVAQVANLAVLNALNPAGGLQNVTAAVNGTGAAPFPVTTSTLTRLSLLQVVPFSLKYTSTAFDRWRVRPYALLGTGVYVTIHEQIPGRGAPASFGVRPDATVPPEILGAVQQLFGGKAPFGGPLVAGQVAQSPELEQRGLPSGHGNIDFGFQGGLGVEFRLSRTLSLGFDSRFNRIAGAPGLLTTYGTRIGLHF